MSIIYVNNLNYLKIFTLQHNIQLHIFNFFLSIISNTFISHYMQIQNNNPNISKKIIVILHLCNMHLYSTQLNIYIPISNKYLTNVYYGLNRYKVVVEISTRARKTSYCICYDVLLRIVVVYSYILVYNILLMCINGVLLYGVIDLQPLISFCFFLYFFLLFRLILLWIISYCNGI